MRYRRAVEKLQSLALACEAVQNWPPEQPFLLEAYVFGEVLTGADPLGDLEVVIVLNLPRDEVIFGCQPAGAAWLADELRLTKGGFAYWWRSHQDPVWNHHIHDAVRFWTRDGADEEVLLALRDRRFDDLPRLRPSADDRTRQLSAERQAALAHLRAVAAAYWDRDWRREHRGLDRYPENDLWEAVQAYLDRSDAAEDQPPHQTDPGSAAGPVGLVSPP